MAQRVLRFLQEDIESCLHTSIVEFLYESQHKREIAAKEMDMRKYFSPMALGDIIDLADAPLADLYSLVTPDLSAECFVRTAEFLVEVVHTHYLITQWHLSPFDPKNEDVEYLHRFGINLHEGDESSNDVIVLNLGGDKSNVSYVILFHCLLLLLFLYLFSCDVFVTVVLLFFHLLLLLSSHLTLFSYNIYYCISHYFTEVSFYLLLFYYYVIKLLFRYIITFCM